MSDRAPNISPRSVAGGKSPKARRQTLNVARNLSAKNPVILVDECLGGPPASSFGGHLSTNLDGHRPTSIGGHHPTNPGGHLPANPDKHHPARETLLDARIPEGRIPEETALILRTSGSTSGTGSLVAISREALLASAKATEEALDGPGRWVTCLPTDHIAGFQTQWRSVVAGFMPIDAGVGRPEDLAQAIEAHFRGIKRPNTNNPYTNIPNTNNLNTNSPNSNTPNIDSRGITTDAHSRGTTTDAHGVKTDKAAETSKINKNTPLYVSLVPTQLRRLLASPAVRAAQSFDAILVGGAAAGTRLLDAARTAGLKVVTTYGMTETCGGCVYDGLPIGDTKITFDSYTSPSTTHTPATFGRIILSGTAVALGYIDDKSSLGNFSKEFKGTFQSNDIGFIENDRLVVTGRADDAITTGGMTIFPTTIEEALTRGGAGECIVIGVEDEEWGEIVVAVTKAFVPPRLREEIAANYGKAYLPRIFLGFTDLGFDGVPLTASGKPDRRKVRNAVRKALA